MNKVETLKNNQRVIFKKRRKVIFEKNKNAYKKLFNNLNNSKVFKQSKIIASYLPINYEIQTEDLNKKILEAGKKLCLPVLLKINAPLVFRAYNNKTNLVEGPFKILEPDIKSHEILPDLILTPCLAYDDLGNRIGYGGGYYDRTIKKVRTKYKYINVIIVAFSEQKSNKIFTNKNDQKTNFILTEKKLLKI